MKRRNQNPKKHCVELLEKRYVLASSIWSSDSGLDHSLADRLRQDYLANKPELKAAFYDYVEDGVLKGGAVDVAKIPERFRTRFPNSANNSPANAPGDSTTVINSGDTANRIDIAVVGDGYQAGEMSKYYQHVDALLSKFFAITPLDEYRSYFNVHRVDVHSVDSGVDNDPNKGVLKNTALDAEFWCSDIERLLCVDVTKSYNFANNAPDVDQVLVLANSTKYGGAGYPANDLGTVSGDNPFSVDVGIHEFGHSFADLADEYDTGGPATYTGPELTTPNVSIYQANQLQTRQEKWFRWLDEPNVDTFEGGNYSQFGVYRPTDNSMMRELGRPFEQVNSEQFIISMYETVKPIDSATAPGSYPKATTFRVSPAVPVAYRQIQWFVNGIELVGVSGTSLNAAFLNVAPGSHSISVRVSDNSSMVRDPMIRDTLMTQQLTWTLEVTLGDAGLQIDIPSSRQYTEDSPPVLLAPEFKATVPASMQQIFSDLDVELSLTNPEPQDSLVITNNGGVSLQGDQILAGTKQLATVVLSTATHLKIRLATVADQSTMETVMKSLGFSNTGNDPGGQMRTATYVFGGSLTKTQEIRVIEVNDAPDLQDFNLPSILEDSTVLNGQRLADIVGTNFQDPDGQFTGIVIVDNPTNPTHGKWYFSSNGTNWAEVGDVTLGGLVLSAQSRLSFRPALNYFGSPDGLLVQAMDDTYGGTFSNSSTGSRVVFDPALAISTTRSQPATVGITVSNVNDPVVATTQSLEFNVVQDQPLSEVIPIGTFVDPDSTVRFSISGAKPSWLSFDSTTRVLSGTPSSRDVNRYLMRLLGTDGQFTTGVDLIVNVINGNDPPEELRMNFVPLPEASSGLLVGTLFFTDPDGDSVTWVSSDPRFTVHDDHVFLESPLDFERQEDRSVPVTFTARDNGTPPRASTLDVVIEPYDINEAYPILVSQEFAVVDGVAAGTLVTRFNAPDADTQQIVRYRLTSGDTSSFSIDEATGELTLAVLADMTKKADYRVLVEAYDSGTPSFSTTAQFKINIVPANAHPPEFAANQRIAFAENIPAGTKVGQVRASDRDNNPLRYSLQQVSGAAVDWMSIDSSTGELFVTAAHRFDFESLLQHEIQILVEETIVGGNQAVGTIPISLEDANDPPSGIANLQIYTNRQGVTATKEFTVVDQDLSVAGYLFESLDPKFETRNGKLALKASEVILPTQTGETLKVPVRVTDKDDANSSAVVLASVMVVSVPAWQNPVNSLDVDRNGRVAPSDALAVINRLNDVQTSRLLEQIRPFEQLDTVDFDVNGDVRVSAVDALQIIEFLNARASGESGSVVSQSPLNRGADRWLNAYQQLEEEHKLRRRLL